MVCVESFFVLIIPPHVFVGPLSPGEALILKSCVTNFSANIFLYHSEKFYHIFMAMGLLESGPYFKVGVKKKVGTLMCSTKHQ